LYRVKHHTTVVAVMGHRERLKGGDENCLFTDERKFVRFTRRMRRWIKHEFTKRIRRAARRQLANADP
jgi:hypothetical protein